MIALQATPEPTPFWLTVAVGLGVGSLVGSVAVAVTSLVGQWRQRIFERTERRDDRAHELALRQLEDKQRLRDRRLATLQDGLTEIVEGLVGLTEVVLQMRFGQASQNAAKSGRQAAGQHFNLARPHLILDPAGREVMEAFRKIQSEIGALETMYRSQEVLLAARPPDAVRHGEELAAQDRKIMEMLTNAADRAQQIMEQAAQPVTV